MGRELTSLPTGAGAERRAADLGLATEAARGDATARRRLAGRLLDRVRRTTAYLAGPGGEAEDLAQVALIKVLTSAGSFRGECTLEFWADRIAVRTVMKSIHKLRRRERLRAAIHDPEPWSPGTDERVARLLLQRRLAAKLQELAPERRAAIVLHHVEGYGVGEIAALTDAPVNTVRDRLRQGRKQLRKKIKADPALRDWVEAMER